MNPTQNGDPLNLNIPYTEKNFEIGFLSSVLHNFILIFFAELGDKTFIMLFILQLRTNKVTIFYSALLAEILMNTLASFCGFLIEYLLYKNLIEHLGILFFVVYGIFLILSGCKISEDTFEEELEMIEEMHKQTINRTPSMILGIEEKEENKDDNENDKTNLDSVNQYNNTAGFPFIKKELTIIPESEISREDSTIYEDTFLSGKKKGNEEDDGGFILGNNNNSGFKLSLKKLRGSSKTIPSNQVKNKVTNLEKKSSESSINESKDNTTNNNITNNNNNIVIEDESNNKDINKENEEEEEEDQGTKLRGKKDLFKSRSRYCLDYLDKNVDLERPNIDSSIFGTIFYSICLSEFGDRTQLISLTTSSIFNFAGSLLGSCLALFCSCLIGVYFSKKVISFFRQKIIDFVIGSIFLFYGIQIYISKMKSQAI